MTPVHLPRFLGCSERAMRRIAATFPGERTSGLGSDDRRVDDRDWVLAPRQQG